MNKYIRIFKWLSVALAGSALVMSVVFLPYFLESLAWRFPEYEFLITPAMFFIWATAIGFCYTDKPNTLVDISDFEEEKMKAVGMYL